MRHVVIPKAAAALAGFVASMDGFEPTTPIYLCGSIITFRESRAWATNWNPRPISASPSRDCGACSERKRGISSSLLRLRLATAMLLAMINKRPYSNDNASRQCVTNHMNEDTYLQNVFFWYIMFVVVLV